MKTKIDRTKEQIIDKQKQRDKATTVFTKLYAHKRGKNKDWSDGLLNVYSHFIVSLIAALTRLLKS